MSIKIENLSKTYNESVALKKVSFEVPKQQIVGFLGPNGAGKSTLMKVLTTYLQPSSGTAQVNGFDIATEPHEVRKSVGYLPEHNPLYLDQYPKEYLAFSARIYKTDFKRVGEVIELTGLQNELTKKIGALSKGYRQRVGLACALLHDPKVLLLDEPTTGLDPNQLEDIRVLIKSLGKDKTVLLSTHIMQEVEAMCDRVLVINKGQLVADRMIGESFEKHFFVTFNKTVLITDLQAIPNTSEVKDMGNHQFTISFISSPNPEEQIFDFAVQKNVKLLQLKEVKSSVEELFKIATN